MMELQVWKERDFFCVRHTVKNPFDEPIYLRNNIKDWFGITGDPELSVPLNKDAGGTPELAYLLDMGDGVALFFQGKMPNPPDLLLAAPRVPLATRVLPGETFRATIRAPLPLREWDAYQPPRDEPTTRGAIRKVELQIQYIRERSARTLNEHINFPGSYVIGGPPEFLNASSDLAEPVTLLHRTDGFHRETRKNLALPF